ncbi:hypothetical protein [Reyranella sp. CPCC 100927]|uniref:hypothetical protein n=1 Tax=Reyranella sp. CPCC 100927 TaxID=2599616 RepID=UPI0011B72671|nr:hypothetical protein [Reyranella sp. CPCC 100927]TWT13943.1 hypothetical protein FQU96_08555 [Reyranella sp. CPCC 100927]
MRETMLLLVAALSLAACGSTIRPAGTAQGGVVTPILGTDDQQLLAAQGHCARYRKNARMNQAIETGSVMFDCTR